MKKKLSIWAFTKQVITEFFNDHALKYSAALSYYTVFSLPPMLLMIITLTGMFFGKELIEGEIFDQFKLLVGSTAAGEFRSVIKNINMQQNSLAAVISIIFLIVGATGVFGEIQDSLNKIWGLKIKTGKKWWKLVLDRLISFSIIASLGFILLVSLALNAIIATIGRHFNFFAEGKVAFQVAETILSFLLSSFFFAVIFKVLPDAKIKWKDVIIGAILTSLLYAAGKAAISYYLSYSQLNTMYGAAGSIIVIMVWAYYNAAILFLGAEFTKVYANEYGGKILPNDYSVWIKVEEVPVSNVTLSK